MSPKPIPISTSGRVGWLTNNRPLSLFRESAAAEPCSLPISMHDFDSQSNCLLPDPSTLSSHPLHEILRLLHLGGDACQAPHQVGHGEGQSRIGASDARGTQRHELSIGYRTTSIDCTARILIVELSLLMSELTARQPSQLTAT